MISVKSSSGNTPVCRRSFRWVTTTMAPTSRTGCFHPSLPLLVWTGKKAATHFKNGLLSGLLDRAQGVPLGLVRGGWDQLSSGQDDIVGRLLEAAAAGGGAGASPVGGHGIGSVWASCERRCPGAVTPFWPPHQEGRQLVALWMTTDCFDGLRYWRGSRWGRKPSRFILWSIPFFPELRLGGLWREGVAMYDDSTQAWREVEKAIISPRILTKAGKWDCFLPRRIIMMQIPWPHSLSHASHSLLCYPPLTWSQWEAHRTFRPQPGCFGQV